MSYHVQIEPRLSVTGAKADRRVRVSPQELGETAVRLAARLAKLGGTAFPLAASAANPPDASLDDLARRLWEARGRSLIVCGSQDARVQMVVNFMNDLLGDYGTTLEWERPSAATAICRRCWTSFGTGRLPPCSCTT